MTSPDRSRRIRRRVRLPLALGAATLTGVVAVLSVSSPAWADSPSDPRATFHSGNVTTCSGVGFKGDTQVGSDSNKDAADKNVAGAVFWNVGPIHPDQGQELDVKILAAGKAAGVVIDAVVVKGGNGYNVYKNTNYLPPKLNAPQHYISPFNNGNKVPEISHWFVCYHVSTSPIPVGTVGGVGLAAVGGVALVAWQRRRRNVGEPSATA